MSKGKIAYVKLPVVKKTDAIVLGCLNSVLDGASDFDDNELCFNSISKHVYDCAYYANYSGIDMYQVDLYAAAMKAAMDSVLDGYDPTMMNEVAVEYHGRAYTYIEVEMAYRRMGFHRRNTNC